MNSIKTRLVLSFTLVVLLSVAILELMLVKGIRQYYYGSVEQILTNQIKVSAGYYSTYLNNLSLEDNIIDNVDVFWNSIPAEVQIVNRSGRILMDSIGVENPVGEEDLKQALSGNKSMWIGRVDYDKSNVMIVSYPLKSEENKIIGALRFIVSLKGVNSEIDSITKLFLLIGFLVICITEIVGLFLAKSIIGPINEVTQTAEKMAAGNFETKSIKKYDDEIGKLSDTINFMAEEINKRERIKNEFISSVSHELRTPLTSIKGWAITLKTGNLDEKDLLNDGLEIIEKESERLTSLVEELLDFSRFSSGKIRVSKELTQLKPLMEYVYKTMSSRARRDDIEFMFSCDDNIPGLYMDKNRMKQVFINILDNAFKFTDKGGVVKMIASKEENYANIAISDNGCGILEDDLPYVKEMFYKGKNSKSQYGIGLSIADEIIKMHNGQLSIDSINGKGTKVTIKIPIKAD